MSLAARPETRRSPAREPAWATIREAAGYARVATITIRRAIGSGRLKAHRVGRKLLVRYADLDRFITQE